MTTYQGFLKEETSTQTRISINFQDDNLQWNAHSGCQFAKVLYFLYVTVGNMVHIC